MWIHLHKSSTALPLITTLAYKSSFSEKVFLGWGPLKSDEKKFNVCRIFLMPALIMLARISMNWAHAFLWVLLVTNFKQLPCCSLIRSGKCERFFFYCDVKSCSYQSCVIIFGCIFDTWKYCLLVSFQSNWHCLLTCHWLILIFLTILIKVCFIDILNTLSVVQDTV